jgi:hypothetical protein
VNPGAIAHASTEVGLLFRITSVCLDRDYFFSGVVWWLPWFGERRHTLLKGSCSVIQSLRFFCLIRAPFVCVTILFSSVVLEQGRWFLWI